MYLVGDTVLVLPMGFVLVEQVLPSGSAVVRDCLGYRWLVGKEASYAERMPKSLEPRAMRRKVEEVVPPPLVHDGREVSRKAKAEQARRKANRPKRRSARYR